MSKIDADGIDDTLTIEAIPTDGWVFGNSDMISIHLDNNIPPIVLGPTSRIKWNLEL